MRGEDVFFSTGTDEHGKKIQEAAEAAGKEPQEFVDCQAASFKELCKKWNISNDYFIRTTDKGHGVVAQAIFKKLYERGDIYLGEYEGLYCTQCENYCLEKGLKNGQCPMHNCVPVTLKEESYFFRLSRYRKKLIAHLQKYPGTIFPDGKRKEILNRLKEPLRDLSVSRTSFDWGIPVPFNKKHIQYVWVDALLNYLTAVEYPKKKFKKYWPADIHLIGVDILWFHYTIWFAILFSLGLCLPKKVVVHGFINTGTGQKMSKSKGTVIDPIALVEQYPLDSIRYFLLREISFGQDGNFSEKALIERNNNELANELGNLLNRTITMIEKYNDGKVPNAKTDEKLVKRLNLKKIEKSFSDLALHTALSEIFSFIGSCNKYINEQQPWKLEGAKRDAVLYSLADSLRVIAILLFPFIPESSRKIAGQLGITVGAFKDVPFNKLKPGTKTKKGKILFQKIEQHQQEQKNARKISVTVKKEVKQLGLNVLSAVIEGVTIKKKHEGLEKLKQKTVHTWEHLPEIEQIVSDYERVYTELGVSAKNSVRNLIGLVEEKGQLPQINTAVDCYNIVSLKYGVVVGAHDLDKIVGNLQFALAKGEEKYIPLGSSQNKGIKKGEFGVFDDAQVVCRLDEKQCENTKIDNNTKHIVLYVQGNKKTPPELLKKARKEICDLIVQYCGGTYKLL